jgi:hypothetical protein
MNSREEIIGKFPYSYKYIMKDYLFDYTKDSEYNKKLKMGSLGSAIKGKIPWTYIDENLNASNNFPSNDFLNNQNDFTKN